MSWRRLFFAVLATLALGAAAVAVAGVSETVATDLRLANRPPTFHGKVKTDVPDCESDRRVKLFYLDNRKGEPGPGTGGELLGRTNSDRKGKWLIETPPVPGAYYAKVKQHIVNIDDVLVRCEPDFSRGIVVNKTRSASREGGAPAGVAGIVHIRNKPPYFHGNIGAENEICSSPRTIKLFGRKGNGDRELLGKTVSDIEDEGVKASWEILISHPGPGSYFATSPKTTMENGGFPVDCARAKSRTIKLG